MENDSTISQRSAGGSNFGKIKGTLWVISLLIAFAIGFTYGKANKPEEATTPTTIPVVATEVPTLQPTQVPAPTAQVTQAIINNNICSKSGFAQKWEYLTSYTIKEGDSLQSIATSQLSDLSRVNEILQINGVGQLILGSTLYLPPPKVTKSSGNIKQVYGRLVVKNDVSWQISFNGYINGQGVVIPSFWFAEIANKESYKVGDCLTILFDDGYKVLSVSSE